MNATLKQLTSDLRSAIATVEAIDAEDLPALVAARLLLQVEATRAELRRAVDAATAAKVEANAGMFGRAGERA